MISGQNPQECICPFRHNCKEGGEGGSIELGLTQLTAGIRTGPTQIDCWTVHNHMVFQIRQQNLAEALGKKTLIESG